MNTDIRISIDFWRHRKTVKLMRRLGPEGAIALQCLWMWAANNCEDGDLTGLDSDDIEISAGWKGEPGELVSALREFGWIDCEDGRLILHDWCEHNPWAFGAKERADYGRMNRLKQVNPKLAHELINQGIEGLSKADYETAKLLKPGSGWRPSGGTPGVPRGYPGPKGGSPAPVPVPVQQITPPLYPPPGGATEGSVENGNNPSNPSQKTGGEPEVTPDNVAPDKPGPPPCPHEQIVEAYHELLPECPRVREWGAPNRKQLAARWREKKERQNLEWWRRVFQHVSESDFLMGRISRDGPFVFSLGWFVKASNFAKVLNGQYENRLGNRAGCAGQHVRRTANQQYMHELGEFLEAIDEVDEGRCRSGIGTTPAALSGGRT